MGSEISGIFLMDPVDGDPYEMGKLVISDETHYSSGTPLLVVSSGFGPLPGFNFKW
jgi:hypothetical protein